MTATPTKDCGRIRFEEVDHTADRAVRIHGRDLPELFVNAAAGMNSLMLSSGSVGEGSVEKTMDLEAMDAESLLVAWLSELAFWAETASLIFSRFDILELSSTRLRALIRGDQVPTPLYQLIYSTSGLWAVAEILPLGSLDGKDIKDWNTLVWEIFFLLIGGSYLAVMFLI